MELDDYVLAPTSAASIIVIFTDSKSSVNVQHRLVGYVQLRSWAHRAKTRPWARDDVQCSAPLCVGRMLQRPRSGID